MLEIIQSWSAWAGWGAVLAAGLTGWLTDRRMKADKLDSARLRQLEAMQELHDAFEDEFDIESGIIEGGLDRRAKFGSDIKQARILVDKYSRFAVDPEVLHALRKVDYLLSDKMIIEAAKVYSASASEELSSVFTDDHIKLALIEAASDARNKALDKLNIVPKRLAEGSFLRTRIWWRLKIRNRIKGSS